MTLPTTGSYCGLRGLQPSRLHRIIATPTSDSSEFSFYRQHRYLGKPNLGFLSQYFRCGLRTS